MFFCLSGHVRSFDKWKSLYFKFHEAISTKLEMAIAYQKGSPAIMVTWHNSRVASKKSYISVFTCLMTTKLDKMMAYGIGHAQSPQVIICNLVTNKKHYISNSTRPMDTKLYRVVAYNMGPKLKTQFRNFLTILSADQTHVQPQIPDLEQNGIKFMIWNCSKIPDQEWKFPDWQQKPTIGIATIFSMQLATT